MALTNAERQRRYRERRKSGEPARRYVTVSKKEPRQSRTQRWADAVHELIALQEEYQEWLESLPENFESTALAEKLEAVCYLDITEIAEIELPLGFGRD